MKIGIISTIGATYPWAGSEEMWRGLALYALGLGHEVVVNATIPIAESSQAMELAQRGCKFIPRPELNTLTRRLAVKGLFSRYSKFFSHPFDVVCLSMGGIADCYWQPDLREGLRKAHIPYMIIVQANAEGIVDDEKQRSSLREIYSHAVAIVFVSDHNLELAERQLGVRLTQASVIPNPLRFIVESLIQWPSSEPDFRMAEVARFEVVDKQQDHLLKALSGKQWRDRNWKLTLYGSGPDEVHIRRLIDLYGVQDKLLIGGFKKDFTEIWRENHLHILPSRREGLSLSLIESMACGRPALVTRAGGNPDLVEHEKSGWVCPGMHPEVLAESLEIAWENRHSWKDMGEAARSRALASLDAFYDKKLFHLLEKA